MHCYRVVCNTDDLDIIVLWENSEYTVKCNNDDEGVKKNIQSIQGSITCPNKISVCRNYPCKNNSVLKNKRYKMD